MRKTQGKMPGDRLRSLRQQRGLTLRDVHEFSLELARRFGQTAFVIPPSRLHEFEKKNIVPSSRTETSPNIANDFRTLYLSAAAAER